MWLTSIALFIIAASADAARAADDCFGPGEPATVAAAAGPLTLRLADGRLLRLADLSPADPGAAPALAALTGADVLLRPLRGEVVADRHGRLLGDVVPKATTESLRAQLLARGLALVDPAVMSEGCLETSFMAERRAERAAKGVWSQRHPVLSAGAPDRFARIGQTVLVEGTVLSVGRSSRTIFLNFGADWRTDFTAMIVQGTLVKWVEEPGTLTGARVRVRGVLEAWNGGLVKVEHPAQIERLDASRGRP
ncbi:OB-fold nucleic acid binding domain-containing protein [Acuticoccus sp. I52.16.1]|uniref:OB-fold nucleic acid binding domain-containing protein n=1 Tax=Acuticoccus sp. I52.16.1 TaxID=2928472 RepID=UPI001FD51A1F|nr:OB-fold nucleic acid binding domain-containing protein [Acuticoccus sp. I52.16.1]UOM32795.1 OB-fold nucleic acid binding domain-containing protein [Acuticoccus sp. I52.16.1]